MGIDKKYWGPRRFPKNAYDIQTGRRLNDQDIEDRLELASKLPRTEEELTSIEVEAWTRLRQEFTKEKNRAYYEKFVANYQSHFLHGLPDEQIAKKLHDALAYKFNDYMPHYIIGLAREYRDRGLLPKNDESQG